MKFTEHPILVVGDLMLDKYVYGTATRISPEAPVPVVKYEREEYKLGGAGNVVANIKALGGNPVPVGVLGSDSASNYAYGLLHAQGVDTQYICGDVHSKTTVKVRLIANGQQISRLDMEEKLGANGNTSLQLLLEHALEDTQPAAIIVSDYDKGVVTSDVLGVIQRYSNENVIPVFIDPKVSNAVEYKRYWKWCILTPNSAEAIGMVDRPHDLEDAGRTILQRYGCSHVLITRGDEGMTLFSIGKSHLSADIVSADIPATAKAVFDVAGAGDTVIATLALAFASGISMRQAATLANRAAGIAVGKKGTATVTHAELFADDSDSDFCCGYNR